MPAGPFPARRIYYGSSAGVLALGLAEGLDLLGTVAEVLFVDAHDTGAAPIAAALLANYARGRIHVSSAGLNPGSAVDATALQALNDIGIDASNVFVKPVTDDALRGASVIVALGVILPDNAQRADTFQQRQTWDVGDIDGEPYDVVRAARDELDRRVLRLLAGLLSGPAQT